MKLRNVLTIFRKDLFDAVRDARILMALIVPFGIAIFYNLTFDDETPLPTATVAYTDVGSELPARLQNALADSVRLRLEPYSTEVEVREVIEDEGASMGLLIPEGFDASLAAGEQPPLGVLFPDTSNIPVTPLTGSVDLVVRQMAETPYPVTMSVEVLAQAGAEGPSILEDLGLRVYFVLAALMMLIGMISMLVVPIILAEEQEKKTLEALTLIASYVEVVAAKALVGIVYVTIGTVLLLLMTGSQPHDPVMFGSGIALLAIALVGLGLLIGGLFRSANQLNTWGGMILLPVIAPAFIVGLWTPGVLEYIIEAIPVSQGMKLAINGMSGEPIFANVWLSYVILVIWIVLFYTLLVFRLSRIRATA
jgi:ABC-type Na+ efflux pump permease subunit